MTTDFNGCLEWTKCDNTWKKRMHGHELKAQKFSGIREWTKYIDGHFRGFAATEKMAKEQLEREASGEGTAWETHK